MKLFVSAIFLIVSVATSSVLPMQRTIVTGASYCIGNGANPEAIDKDCCLYQYVTFYTYDGNEIVTLEQLFNAPLLTTMLDPEAPKPQPVRFEIKKIDVAPGWVLFFYDKHGNQIKNYPYDQSHSNIWVVHNDERPQFPFSADRPKNYDNRPVPIGFALDLSKL